MILQRLAEYAARMERKGEFPPPMYDGVEIGWLINLSESGELQAILQRDVGKKSDVSGKLTVPFVRRAGNAVKPRLLADNSEYVLCDPRRDSDPTKVRKVEQRHTAFVELAKKCFEVTRNPQVGAVVAFLEEWKFDPNIVPTELLPTDKLTFQIGSRIPSVEDTDIQQFWSSYTSGMNSSDESSGNFGMCLVSGKHGPTEERIPVPVKGLLQIGGKAENSLVSANKKAFESYGLENSLTSPISRDAAERFGKALNHLLADRDSRIYIGGTLAYVWWAKESGFSLRLVSEPEEDPEAVYRLMDSARSGRKRVGSEAEKFFCLALSASGGRAVVRDWLETTIPEVEANIGEWFASQEIVDAYGNEMAPFGVFRLAAAAYRDAVKEMQPSIPAAMIRVALNGGRLPDDLLARAVRRNVVGTVYPNSETTEHVTRERAALMKLIFTTQGRFGMEEMKSLETSSRLGGADGAAYSCGRLLAELEQIQREALGRSINTTLVDRYYGAASTTPGKVFGLLVANAQDHLSKIRKSRGGTHEALQRKLEEIMAPLDRYPSSLDVGRQGLFSLGYYHQRAENRAAARAAKEAKEEAKTEGEENG